MTFKNIFKTAKVGLFTNKSRSVLTIIGIVIGITAIIVVVSVGNGAQNLILSQVQGMGSKTIAVVPGRQPTGPSDFAQILSESLKIRDLDLLRRKENVPTGKEVMPVVFGAESASYQGETYSATVMGSTERAFRIFDLDVSPGRLFTEDEVRGFGSVVVIGDKVKEELFGESQAVGERIKIKNVNLRVIGVLPGKGQVSFFNFDDMILLPYTTAQSYIFGIKHFHRFIVEADSEENIERTVRDVEATLRTSHNIPNPEKDDFFVETQADLAERLSTITSVLTLFLASIAAISLLVGGVGIMNIMLVSVTERTREIGLRKAIGATEKNILTQFLFEAVLLTALGGVIGVVSGAVLSFLVALVLGQVVGLPWQFTFPVSAALLGLAVSALVGLVFGLYPARKAAQKSPIEALRYE